MTSALTLNNISSSINGFQKSGAKNDTKKNEVLKNTLIASGILAGVLGADLFLAKGKIINGLLFKKISFLKHMSNDLDNVVKSDSYATRNRLEAFLSVPGLHALWAHRIIHKLDVWGIPVIPRALSNISRFFTGIEIHPGARIGQNVFIDHTGAIIGETAKIGNNVTIIGRVVLGSTGKGDYLRHTIVEDNVVIGMNSTMLGRINLGKNSKIGAGTLICHDVPPNVTVIGNPAKIITVNGERLKTPIFLSKDSVKELKAS